MANTQTGQVVKITGQKTIKVLVITYKNHPLYKKRYIYSKKYLVHDPQSQAQLDDKVVIKQSRPFSRHKRWSLEKVIPTFNKTTKSVQTNSQDVLKSDKSKAKPTKSSRRAQVKKRAEK